MLELGKLLDDGHYYHRFFGICVGWFSAECAGLFALQSEASQPGTLQRGEDFVFIKCSNKFEKIQFSDILYIEALQNYVAIYTSRGKYLTLLYLKNIEQNLDSRAFIRVHKSYIVPIGRIDSIDGNEIRIGTHRIPVSRNYRDQVIDRVVNNNLWSKLGVGTAGCRCLVAGCRRRMAGCS